MRAAIVRDQRAEMIVGSYQFSGTATIPEQVWFHNLLQRIARLIIGRAVLAILARAAFVGKEGPQAHDHAIKVIGLLQNGFVRLALHFEFRMPHTGRVAAFRKFRQQRFHRS